MSRFSFCSLGLLFLALNTGACDRPKTGPAAAQPGNGLNVLLITLDTTRADRLGCYGYAPAQTPALDGLAAGGVRFTQAFSQVPLTLPSHASLLTGLYPPSTGMHVNGSGVLAEDVPTLAEAFKAHGYRTGAFVAAWVLDHSFGLNRGFDRYDDRIDHEEGAVSDSAERPANEVCDAALSWLDEPATAPFFAWVHFFDPHRPYAPPAKYREKLADPYDGEVAFMDSQVGRLLQWLDARHLRNRTLIIAVGDHGEAFGEHGEQAHGLLLYDTTMRVPFIVSLPGRLPGHKVVTTGVRLVDVVPTIRDLLDWPPQPGLAGQSFRPALTGDGLPFLSSYGETEYPAASFGWAALHSFTTERWKYIAAPRPELYDRAADPGELVNLVDENAAAASQARDELTALLDGMEHRVAESARLDDAGRRALESLGYIGASSPAAGTDEAPPGHDPKDMLNVLSGLAEAHQLMVEQRVQEAIALLESLVTQSPESDELHAVLSELYLRQGRFREAETAALASLRRSPTDPVKLCRLGDALYRQQKIPEAIKCYEQTLAASADYGPAHNRLAVIYSRQGQLPQALAHLRRCVEINPTSANALANLANTLVPMKQPADAVDLLKKALTFDPTHALSHQSLWRALLAAGRNADALEALTTACRTLPQDCTLKRNLAHFLARAPQIDRVALQEALTWMQECCAAQPDDPENLDALALACAAAGDFPRAVEHAQQAITLAQAQNKRELAARIAKFLEAYQAGRRP